MLPVVPPAPQPLSSVQVAWRKNTSVTWSYSQNRIWDPNRMQIVTKENDLQTSASCRCTCLTVDLCPASGPGGVRNEMSSCCTRVRKGRRPSALINCVWGEASLTVSASKFTFLKPTHESGRAFQTTSWGYTDRLVFCCPNALFLSHRQLSHWPRLDNCNIGCYCVYDETHKSMCTWWWQVCVHK